MVPGDRGRAFGAGACADARAGHTVDRGCCDLFVSDALRPATRRVCRERRIARPPGWHRAPAGDNPVPRRA
jgi:hypothetical protein